MSWSAPRKAAPVPGGPPRKAAPVPHDLPDTFQPGPPKKPAPRRPTSGSGYGGSDQGSSSTTTTTTNSSNSGPPNKSAPSPFRNNSNSGPPNKSAPSPFRNTSTSATGPPRKAAPSIPTHPTPQLPTSTTSTTATTAPVTHTTAAKRDPYDDDGREGRPSSSSNTNISSLPPRSSFTSSRPEERAPTTTTTTSPFRGHFSAAPRRKAKVNPDNGVTVLPHHQSNLDTSSTKSSHQGVIMATLGGAPAKRAARSTHLERGENPITLPSQEDTIARRPDEEYVLRFGGYLDTSEYSDVSFCCQDNSPQQILRAHRIIIASHSDVLKEIMRDQKGEGEENDVIVLDRSVCLDPRSFAACLSWMYRREEPSVSTGALHLASVMGCSTSLSMDVLPTIIFEQLHPLVDLTNVQQIMNIADFFHLENLLNICINLCAKEMDDTTFKSMIHALCAEAEASLVTVTATATTTATATATATTTATTTDVLSSSTSLTSQFIPVRLLVLRLLSVRTVAPMALAVRLNLLSVVRTLLDSSQHDTSDLLRDRDEEGARPLELALRLGHDALVEPLVVAGDEVVVNQRMTPSRRGSTNRPGGTRADHFKMEAGEQTMLHLAAASGNAHHCRVLIAAGADVNAVNSTGRSPLHLAVLSGDLESLRLLLERGVAPNLQDANGHTALHLVTGGDLPEDVLDVDLATYDDLDVGMNGESGMQQNVQSLQQSSSQRQLESPKKRSAKSGEVTFNFTPLPLSKAGRVVDELLQTKINVHIPDGKGRTPLHVAVWRGALDITQRLLEAGADPSTKDYQGNTSLHFAAQTACRDSVAIVRALLGPDTTTNTTTTATTATATATATTPTNLLTTLPKMASPNETNAQNVTALHVAAATCGSHEQSEDVLHALLQRGGDPNLFDKRGLTPLHMLAAAHLPQSNVPARDGGPGGRVVDACVSYGHAKLDLRAGAGNKMTALHIAVENNNFELANALVRNGAAVSIPDSAGRCALGMVVGHAREVNVRRLMLLSSITKPPYWVPDDALSNCMECGSEFSFSRRRSHCRHCGRLVCKSCAPKKSKIEKLGEKKPVRVCNPCLDVLTNTFKVNDAGGGGFPTVETGGRR